MFARLVAAIVALAALTSACALKAPPDPADLRRQALPNLQLPERWATDGAEGAPVTAGWLGGFGDRMLTALVEEALAYNNDLRVAGARVDAAAGYATLAGAALYPAVSLLARGGAQMSGDNSGLQCGALVASWELDVWGRVRYGRAAAEAQYASAVADLEYARQSLAALVVKSWVLAVEARLQRAVAEDAVRALRAFGEVENALAAEFGARDREKTLTDAVAQRERAAELSRVAFEVGSIDLRPVQQQLGLYAARSALLRTQSEQRVQRVNLHLALGGGFGDADAMLHDWIVTHRASDSMVIDVYRVIGNGETSLDAPPEGWPPGVRVRLHGFISLERLVVKSGAADMQCSASSSLIRGKGYECESGGTVTGRSVARDDYVEFTVPDTLLGPDVTRVDVRWAEVTVTRER